MSPPPGGPGAAARIRREQAVHSSPLYAVAQANTAAAHAPFDQFAELIRLACGTPAAVVTLIDGETQYVLGRSGDSTAVPDRMPFESTLCREVILSGGPALFSDLSADPRVADDIKAYAAAERISSYASVPIADSDGEVLGTVCAFDARTRVWSEDDVAALSDIATGVLAEGARRAELLDESTSLPLMTEIFDAALDAVVVADLSGVIRAFNPAAEAMFGHVRAEVLHQLTIARLVPTHLRAAHRAGFHRFAGSGEESLPRLRRRSEGLRRDGTRFPIELTLTTARASSTRLVVAHIRDLSSDLAHEQALVDLAAAQAAAASTVKLLAQQLDAVLDSAPTILFAIDRTERFTLAAGAGLSSLGLVSKQLLGQTIEQAYGPRHDILTHIRRALTGESVRCVLRFRGRVFDNRMQPVRDADGTLLGSVGVSNDITEQVEKDDELRRLATFDTLTGLLNRHGGEARIAELLEAGGPLALLLIDLDHFKDINDSLGHPAGDEVLRCVAARILDVVPSGAVVSRLGGDELLVALTGEAADRAPLLTGTILEAIAEPLSIESTTPIELGVTASIGLARSPEDGRTLSTLLARADSAMFNAKRSGRNGYACYAAGSDTAHRRLSVTTRLRRAISAGTVDVHFQPLMTLRSGRPCGFEALARWTDDELGPISPVEFIGLAEETGLIGHLTDLVVTRSLAAAATWPAGVGVAINLAAGLLTDRGLPRRLADAAAAASVPAGAVTFELTESATIGDDAAGTRALRSLVDAGFQIALDDFGVGYSSLARLRDLSADGLMHAIKLDRSFVADLPSPRARSLVSAFVQTAAAMDLPTVAEGIETSEQLEAVLGLGCTTGQGWLFAKAMPADDVAGWLRGRYWM